MESTTTVSGWERSQMAAENVKERLRRAASTLRAASIPYAVVGGNAVAEWVGRADEAAVRHTRDVDILIRRQDLEAAKTAMASAGFIYRHVKSIDMFLDGPGTKARDAVHLLYSGEKVRPDDLAAAPEVTDSELTTEFNVLNLESLVRMKLTSYRLKDRVHLQDMIEVGLIDSTWPAKFIPELGARLQAILDNPDG